MRTSKIFWRALGAVLVLAGFLMVGGTSSAVAQEVLTNDSVISMVKGGLGEAVVLARIRSSPCQLRHQHQSAAGAQEGRRLRQGHRGHGERAPERRGRRGPRRPHPAAPSAATSAPVSASIRGGEEQRRRAAATLPRDLIFHPNGANYVEMQPQVVEIEVSNAACLVEERRRAGRAQGGVSHHRQAAAVLQLLRADRGALVSLPPGDKKNDRNLKMGSGGYHPYGELAPGRPEARTASRSRGEREANGFYRISPSSPLPAGEYGFIVLSGATAGGRMFDFGVD
mgnify:CR=1 FL=1